MARPRTPTNILDGRGSFKEHPERKQARADEPQITEPLGDPPKSLKGVALKKIWRELSDPMPDGVLTAADRATLELACRLLLKIREDKASTGEISSFQRCLAAMGMTPADRSRVKVPSKKQAGKWDD